MRVVGLLGGMSWESSIEYERVINQRIRAELGGVASADLIIRSFNFADIERLQMSNDWVTAGNTLAGAAHALEMAGAEALVLCTNTMHAVADEIEAQLSIPLLHIGDPTGDAVTSAGISTVGLLGTRFTMEQNFLSARLTDRFNLTVLVPSAADRTRVHDVIYEELVQGVIREESRRTYVEIVERLIDAGAQGIIAGCTEIELLLREEDIPVPLFATARLHAEAAAAFALS